MEYWQIASGSFGRDYAEYFLQFGMAFVGGEHQRRMMKEVKCGDRVILKSGKSIVAVGVVEERNGRHKGDKDDGGKEWLSDFDGWDLPAYCFVAWREIKPPRDAPRSATIQRVRQPDLIEWAEGRLASLPVRERANEPPETHSVADDQIVEHLIKQGLNVRAAEQLTDAFKRSRRLAQYYYDKGDEWEDVREHETRTFLVIPLLLALGWAEQHIKIELPVTGGRRVDIACFAEPYTKKSRDPVMLIESKGFSQGLDYVDNQAKRYADHFPDCRLVVVTNGYCYKTFERDAKGDYSQRPSAYLNLLHPRDRYPLDPIRVDGCLEALRLLLPHSRMQDQSGRRQAPAQQ